MEKNGTDHLVTLEIAVSHDEEKRFQNYVQQGKFGSHRLAFNHMLRLAEGGDMEEDKVEVMETKGDIDEPKDAKKGKARKGKKAMEEAAVSDMEMKHDEVAPAPVAESTDDKDAPKEDDAKKAKGRRGKKAAEEAVPSKNGGHHDEQKISDHEDASGDEEQPKQGRKRAPAKKAPVRKGQQETAVELKRDATFILDNAAVEPEPTKKAARGKKAAAAAIAEEPDEHEDGEGDAGDNPKGKSKTVKADGGDGVPDAKKRRGKEKKNDDDDDYQEPATATKGRSTKKAAAAKAETNDANADHLDEPVPNGESKKGGKRKPAAPKTATVDTPAEETATAKPKRGRAAKQNKNYADHDDDDCC